jgi:hypothetical protein
MPSAPWRLPIPLSLQSAGGGIGDAETGDDIIDAGHAGFDTGGKLFTVGAIACPDAGIEAIG